MNNGTKAIAGVEMVPGEELTAYEELRASKIERNNKMLFDLGLISSFEMKVSNLRARGANVSVVVQEPADGEQSESESSDWESGDEGESDDVDENEPDGKRKGAALKRSSNQQHKRKRKKQRRTSSAPREGFRKSLRLKGLNPDGGELQLPSNDEEVSAQPA